MKIIDKQASSWDRYAQAFSIITTYFQSEVYRDIASKLYGEVGDFGAGSAKILPYLVDSKSMQGYTGIDASNIMVDIGRQVIERLDLTDCQMVHSTIENLENKLFDSAVSINSYYVWDKPEVVLDKIFSCLSVGADFFLVTPNKSLNMPLLLEISKKEHLMNPAYEDFMESNTGFNQEMNDHFVSIDLIIEQARKVGFIVKACHQNYYLGGVNYLHLQRLAK